MKSWIALAALIACFTSRVPASARARSDRVLYVATNGDDAWSGTLASPNAQHTDGPLATLAAARDKLREQKAGGSSTVMVRGGTYPLPDTFVLGPDDSGTPGHPVTYCSFPNERAVLTGGRILKGWHKEGKLWVTDVPQDRGRWYFAQLYINGKLQRRSWEPDTSDWHKWPLTTRGFPHDELHLPQRAVDLYYPDDLLKNWPNLNDVEVTILPQFRWSNNVIPLKSVDEASKHAVLASPGTYNINKNDPFRVENTLEGINQPGEWRLSTKEGKIYLLAPEGVDVPAAQIIAPKLYTLVQIQGDEKSNHLVHDIIFRGFTFIAANRHQSDEVDASRPDAAIYLSGVTDCAIEDCQLIGVANDGIDLYHAATNNRILNNEIAEAGGCAIRLHGYEPGTTDVNKRNRVERNDIHDTALDFWGSPAIDIWQSGENLVAYNDIHDVGYSGISLTGAWVENFQLWKDKPGHGFNWKEIPADDPLTRLSVKKYLHARNNRIEHNVIHDFLQTGFYDIGGIYTMGLGAGNVLNANLIYHAPMERSYGISLDFQSDYLTVTNNLVFDCNTAASNSDSLSKSTSSHEVLGNESNHWKGNLLYGSVFAGAPPVQAKVAPPEIIQAAALMTELAKQTTGPSWSH